MRYDRLTLHPAAAYSGGEAGGLVGGPVGAAQSLPALAGCSEALGIAAAIMTVTDMFNTTPAVGTS
jgi:hypothetical protein